MPPFIKTDIKIGLAKPHLIPARAQSKANFQFAYKRFDLFSAWVSLLSFAPSAPKLRIDARTFFISENV